MGRNPNLICIPNFRYYEVKNPKTLFPVNWVAKYGEDRVRYELEPEYDKDGNYLGTKENVYVTMKEIGGYRFIKRLKSEKSIPKEKLNFIPRKLFETYSDMVEREEKENGQCKQENSCNIH